MKNTHAHLVKDRTGERHGMLTVLHRGENMYGKTAWVCRCDCGNIKTVSSLALRKGQKSCGCLAGFRNKSASVGLIYRKSHRNKLYNQWSGMIYRCTHESASHYEFYGGKGISVCREWMNDFTAFVDWAIANGYTDKMEIDRIDNDGDYEPSNCRWIDHKKNSRNRGTRRASESGRSGVIWRPSRTGEGGAWRVGIMADGKQITVGTYGDLTKAIEARKAAELEHWGFIAGE